MINCPTPPFSFEVLHCKQKQSSVSGMRIYPATKETATHRVASVSLAILEPKSVILQGLEFESKFGVQNRPDITFTTRSEVPDVGGYVEVVFL